MVLAGLEAGKALDRVPKLNEVRCEWRSVKPLERQWGVSESLCFGDLVMFGSGVVFFD